MVQMDNYSDYLLLWSPRDKKLWYLDIEHEEFHPDVYKRQVGDFDHGHCVRGWLNSELELDVRPYRQAGFPPLWTRLPSGTVLSAGNRADCDQYHVLGVVRRTKR